MDVDIDVDFDIDNDIGVDNNSDNDKDINNPPLLPSPHEPPPYKSADNKNVVNNPVNFLVDAGKLHS